MLKKEIDHYLSIYIYNNHFKLPNCQIYVAFVIQSLMKSTYAVDVEDRHHI